MNRAVNIVIVLQFAWLGLASEMHEGQICTLADGITHGTCRQDTNCRYLKTIPQEDLRTCSFEASSRIVCCPDKDVTGHFKRKSDEMCANFAEMPVVGNHILGGTEAEIEDFPYLGALALQDYRDAMNKSEYGCGASLISDRFLLTAASCLIHKRVDHARFGTLSLKNDDEDPVIFGIKRAIIHPDFSRRPIARNDIALLELNRTVVEEFLIPACLYTEPSDPLPSEPLTIAGWGSTDSNDWDMSSILLKAQVSTYERNKCDSDLKKDSNRLRRTGLHSGQLCALGKRDDEHMNDTCVGDSGGPLELPVGRRKYIVGITSSGKVCGTKFPSIYTRVSHYIDWIESIVWT